MPQGHDPLTPHPGPTAVPEAPSGRGPLADSEPTGGPIDDPAMADRANPRWDEPTTPQPDAQPLSNDDGSPNVMPPDTLGTSFGEADLAEQAARPLEGRDEPGSDNIRQGRGGGTPNPALAEGGDNG